jgi:hypothetical protein
MIITTYSLLNAGRVARGGSGGGFICERAWRRGRCDSGAVDGPEALGIEDEWSVKCPLGIYIRGRPCTAREGQDVCEWVDGGGGLCLRVWGAKSGLKIATGCEIDLTILRRSVRAE